MAESLSASRRNRPSIIGRNRTIAAIQLSQVASGIGRPRRSSQNTIDRSNQLAILILGAGFSGFFLGADRVASMFSFFWGTHEFWPRLHQKLDDLRDQHFDQGKMLVVLLAILGIVLWVQFA